jgi:hypothetical protein
MDDFHRIPEVDSQHHILIFQYCQCAVISSHVKTYLNTHHKRLGAQKRADFVSKVERSIKLAKLYADVVYPLPTESPTTSLPLFFDSLALTAMRNGMLISMPFLPIRAQQRGCESEFRGAER